MATWWVQQLTKMSGELPMLVLTWGINNVRFYAKEYYFISLDKGPNKCI